MIDRGEFEKLFPVPDDVAWIGNGYAPTEYSADQGYNRMWKAWQAARAQSGQGDGWIKYIEDQPLEIDVDVKLRDGSVIRGCLAQSDGDFYWKGGGSEMFILEHEVVEWRPQPPKEGE